MLLHFRIQLANINKPPVWRELTVPAQFSFHRFHKIIQAAFGWADYHLYDFSEKGYDSDWSIGIPSGEDFKEVRDSQKVKLSQVFKTKGQKLIYLYDFGDDWNHEITLREIRDEKATKAALTGGKGMCPPEDCGGPFGYADLKAIMKDPKHEEYASMREWLGVGEDEAFDPAFFELEAAQREVSRV